MREDTADRLRAACATGRGDMWDCALERAGQASNQPDVDLITVGKSFGLTPSESVGVMDGWDTMRRGRGFFRGQVERGEPVYVIMDGEGTVALTVDRAEYDAGFSLGSSLWDGSEDESATIRQLLAPLA